MMNRILVINIGSTSTKVGLFEEEKQAFRETLNHSPEKLRSMDTYEARLGLHRKTLEGVLTQHEMKLAPLHLVVSRGALTRPVQSGAYLINEVMVQDLRSCRYGWHPSNVGPELALEIARRHETQAIIYDSPSTDEMDDIARFSGLKGIERRAAFHVLNQKSAARRAASRLNIDYKKARFVIAHLGGGITIVAYREGRIIDGSHGLSEGPFTPQRTGSLPLLDVLELCFSGQFTHKEVQSKLFTQGGVSSYLGTHNMVEVEQRAKRGEQNARMVLQALAYQVSKDIGSMATVLKGKIDAVVLTGNLARSETIVEEIKERVGFLGNVLVFPGEDELEALAYGGLAVLKGAEKIKQYPPEPP